MNDIGIKGYSKNIKREIIDGESYIDILNNNLIFNITLIDDVGIGLVFNYKDKYRHELGIGCHISLYKSFNTNTLEITNPDSSSELYKVDEENYITGFKLLFDKKEYKLSNKQITYYYKNQNSLYPYKIYNLGKVIEIDNNIIKYGKYKIELNKNNELIEELIYKVEDKLLARTKIEYKNGYINKIIKERYIENVDNYKKEIEINIESDHIEIKDLDTLNGNRYNLLDKRIINIETINNSKRIKDIEFTYNLSDYNVDIKNRIGNELDTFYNKRIVNGEEVYFKSLDINNNSISLIDYNESNFKENFSNLIINKNSKLIKLNYPLIKDEILNEAYDFNTNLNYSFSFDKKGLANESLVFSLIVKSDEISSYSNLNISVETQYKGKLMDTFDNILIKNDFIGYKAYSKGIICKNTYDSVKIYFNGKIRARIGNIYLDKNYATYYSYKDNKLDHVEDLINNKSYDYIEENIDFSENLNDLFNYFNISEFELTELEKKELGYNTSNTVKRYIKTVDNKNIIEEKEYNDYDQLISEKSNSGIVKKYEYDSFLNLKKVIDSLGNTKEFIYKDYKDLVSIIYNTNDKNDKIDYKYENGKISEVIINDKVKYNFIYDGLNISEIKLSDMTIFRYLYDEYDNITREYLGLSDNYYEFIYLNNNIVEIKYIELNCVLESFQFEYDEFLRLTIVKKNNNEILVHNKYDIRGNLVKAINSKENIEYLIENNILKRKNIEVNGLKKINTFQEYNSLKRSQTNDIKTFIKDLNKINKYNFATYHKNYDIEGCKEYRGYIKTEKNINDSDELYEMSNEDFKNNSKFDSMSCISGSNHIYYRIDNQKNLLNFSIAMWFKPEESDKADDYIFSIVEESHHISDKKIVSLLKESDGLNLLFNEKITVWQSSEDELIKIGDWNFFAMSFRTNTTDIEINMNINGRLISYTTNKKYSFNGSKIELNIGFIQKNIDIFNHGSSKITLVSFEADKVYDNNMLTELYNLGYDYVENNKSNYYDRNQEMNVVDFSQVYNVKLSSFTLSSYKIFLLNNNLNSITYNSIDDNIYDKPSFIKNRELKVSDSDPIFNYSKELNRYVYVARDNLLEYETNIYESGSLMARFYFEGSNNLEYLFDSKDKNNNKLQLFRSKDKELILKYNYWELNSHIVLENNKWYDIALSFDTNLVSASLSSSRNRIFKLIVDNDIKNFNITDNSTLSNLRISLGNKLLDNKDEYKLNSLNGLISNFAYSNIFQFEASVHNLFKELNGLIYTTEYDKCETIRKKKISLYQNTILNNEYYYSIEDNRLSNNVLSEYINNIKRKYSYDKVGNVVKIIDNTFGNKEYKYNNKGYLIEEKDSNNTISYTYDDYGNMKSYKINDNNYFLRYRSDNPYILKRAYLKKVSHSDDYINIVEYDNKTLKYNGKRLVEINIKNSDSIEQLKFEYNHLGLRTKKEYIKIYSNGEEETKTYNYLYEDDKLIYESDGTNSNYYLYDEYNNIYGFIQNKNYYFYLRDYLGNILALIDKDKNIVVKYSYNAYGQNMSSEGKVYNPIRYKGYYYDIETDMYYCKSRYYVPNLFRWISMDSINYLDIESISGNNLYMYCNNNPVMFSDINGNFAVSSFLIGLAVSSLFGWGLSQIFGSEIASGILTSVNGGTAIYTGASLLSFGPVGWIAGGGLILVGIGTLCFGVNDIASGITGTNYIQEWIGMSESSYNGWRLGLNLASSVGTIAGNIYMNYANVSGTSNPGRSGKPFSRYSTIDDQGVKQYRFFNSKGQAWYDVDFRHSGNNIKFPHYHGWENGIRTTDHWDFWNFLKWLFWRKI